MVRAKLERQSGAQRVARLVVATPAADIAVELGARTTVGRHPDPTLKTPSGV